MRDIRVMRVMRVIRDIRIMRIIRDFPKIPTIPNFPTIPNLPLIITSIFQSRLKALLLDASFFQEFPVNPVDETPEQNQRLMNHNDGDIRYILITATFYLPTIPLAVIMFLEKRDACLIFRVLLPPALQMMNTKVVFIIFQKFLQATLGDDSQFMMGGRRPLCVAISFYDILFP